MSVCGSIDTPIEDELVYQHGFQLSGWADAGDGQLWKAVVVRLGADIVGATALQVSRPDVSDALGVQRGRLGFIVRCTIAEHFRGLSEIDLECLLVTAEDEWLPFATRRVRLSDIDYRIHGHGYLLTDGPAPVMVRDHVYGSGPPSPVADSRCVALVMDYVLPGESVLDVGCGIGAYYHSLTPYGVTWSGCETRADFVAIMQAAGLPASLVTDVLPFPDKYFDATICIEVLEHVPAYEAFLAEVARVSRRAAVFSVPNFAAIPVTSSRYALPWHMLESDHKNFFTTRSLVTLLERYYRHVETFEYGPLPLLHSVDGIAINNHVFAVCYH